MLAHFKLFFAYIIIVKAFIFEERQMSIQEYLNENTAHRRNRKAEDSSTNTLSHCILVAYPCERIAFSIAVRRPVGHTVQVKAEGLPKRIASIIVNPGMSTAPFTSSITVSVNRGAVLGNYPFNLTILRYYRG